MNTAIFYQLRTSPTTPLPPLTLESFVQSVLQGVSAQLRERPQISVFFFPVFFVHFEFDLQEGENKIPDHNPGGLCMTRFGILISQLQFVR